MDRLSLKWDTVAGISKISNRWSTDGFISSSEIFVQKLWLAQVSTVTRWLLPFPFMIDTLYGLSSCTLIINSYRSFISFLSAMSKLLFYMYVYCVACCQKLINVIRIFTNNSIIITGYSIPFIPFCITNWILSQEV